MSSQLWISDSPLVPTLSKWVLDAFEVDQQEYLVVLLAGLTRVLKAKNNSSDESILYREISRFEVAGQSCAVIKVEQKKYSVATDLASLLTQRELQIATLVALGQPNKQIAHQLRISEWTVSTHLRRIFMKLGVDSRAAMVYRCAELIQKLQEQPTFA